jgi:hypothetical protein
MCGCEDCPTCHPENFRNGVYMDAEHVADEQNARDMERDPVAYLIRVAEDTLAAGPLWEVDANRDRLRAAIAAAKKATQ